MAPATVNNEATLSCLKKEAVYPGGDVLLRITRATARYLRRNNIILTGGWSLHLHLRAIGSAHRVYDETSICGVSDFDVISHDPVKHMKMLADHLFTLFPNLGFQVTQGIQPNLLRLELLLLKYAFVDMIYVPRDVFDRLPVVLVSGALVMRPFIELTKLCTVLQDVLFIMPGKIDQVLTRLAMMETLLPLKPGVASGEPSSSSSSSASGRSGSASLKLQVRNDWWPSHPLAVGIGSLADAAINGKARRQKPTSSQLPLEFAVHDPLYEATTNNLLAFISSRQGAGKQQLVVERHAPMLSIGPAWSGWTDVQTEHGDPLIRVFSLPAPVPFIASQNESLKTASYYIQMAHLGAMVVYYSSCSLTPAPALSALYVDLFQTTLSTKLAANDPPRYLPVMDHQHMAGVFPARSPIEAYLRLRKKLGFFHYLAGSAKNTRQLPHLDRRVGQVLNSRQL